MKQSLLILLNTSLLFAGLYSLPDINMSIRSYRIKTLIKDPEFHKVCSYDSSCHFLVHFGYQVKPSRPVIKIIQAFKKEINVTAEKYNVPREAIAGSILAENSIHVSIDDKIMDYLAKNNGPLPADPSLGLGQIKVSRVLEAQSHTVGRPVSDRSTVRRNLLKPAKAIDYIGQIIQSDILNYKKQGIDISQQPAILVSLFNLGNSRVRAQRAKMTGRHPRMSYFGYFAKKHFPLLLRILN